MNLEHLVVPESNEVLRKQKDECMLMGRHGGQLERVPKGQNWNILRKTKILGYKISTGLYNLKYEIYLHEYKLIQIND